MRQALRWLRMLGIMQHSTSVFIEETDRRLPWQLEKSTLSFHNDHFSAKIT
jgi:hypothetical protein